MIGMSHDAASSEKCRATASELIFGIRGGLIMTAAAPASRACRVYCRQVRRPSAVAPATTGTRPLTCWMTVSSTRPRSRSDSRATSLVTPSAVTPFTPPAMNRSTTRWRLSWSTSPAGSKGVGRTENTPEKRPSSGITERHGTRIEPVPPNVAGADDTNAPAPEEIAIGPVTARVLGLSAIAAAAALLFLRAAAALLVPIFISVLLAYALEPAVAGLMRLRLPRVIAAILVYALVGGSVAFGVRELRRQVAAFLEDFPRAIASMPQTGSGDRPAQLRPLEQ